MTLTNEYNHTIAGVDVTIFEYNFTLYKTHVYGEGTVVVNSNMYVTLTDAFTTAVLMIQDFARARV